MTNMNIRVNLFLDLLNLRQLRKEENAWPFREHRFQVASAVIYVRQHRHDKDTELLLATFGGHKSFGCGANMPQNA